MAKTQTKPTVTLWRDDRVRGDQWTVTVAHSGIVTHHRYKTENQAKAGRARINKGIRADAERGRSLAK